MKLSSLPLSVHLPAVTPSPIHPPPSERFFAEDVERKTAKTQNPSPPPKRSRHDHKLELSCRTETVLHITDYYRRGKWPQRRVKNGIIGKTSEQFIIYRGGRG
ncbi:hypothetical protein GWI33_016306 [Rhynchophorus ferrugineus]|uniref:Uncharacterized protein n=1 Tax=Rhynchophorus ferrugineus TaxID=354439 RepID=A0A834I104_RHYFE|nr:hypothetical protein GWI33_016306 [Rhynchophorus ferrugineus]